MPYCLPAGSGKGGEKGRAHSLLVNSIQKDADSRSEVRRRGRTYVRAKTAEFIPSNNSGLLNNVKWLMNFWIPYCSNTVRNSRL